MTFASCEDQPQYRLEADISSNASLQNDQSTSGTGQFEIRQTRWSEDWPPNTETLRSEAASRKRLSAERPVLISFLRSSSSGLAEGSLCTRDITVRSTSHAIVSGAALPRL